MLSMIKCKSVFVCGSVALQTRQLLVSRTATHQQKIKRNKMKEQAVLLGAVLLGIAAVLSYAYPSSASLSSLTLRRRAGRNSLSAAWVTAVDPASSAGMSNVAFFPVTANTGSFVEFGLASSPATGGGPESLAVGDFNGRTVAVLKSLTAGSGVDWAGTAA